ncbi:hypothetical protein EC1999001_0987 [Escherichia coli 199900.1]|nr:hypothetical protein EC1999001_0987 [Escherichia coli 199900.1]
MTYDRNGQWPAFSQALSPSPSRCSGQSSSPQRIMAVFRALKL